MQGIHRGARSKRLVDWRLGRVAAAKQTVPPASRSRENVTVDMVPPTTSSICAKLSFDFVDQVHPIEKAQTRRLPRRAGWLTTISIGTSGPSSRSRNSIVGEDALARGKQPHELHGGFRLGKCRIRRAHMTRKQAAATQPMVSQQPIRRAATRSRRCWINSVQRFASRRAPGLTRSFGFQISSAAGM